MYIAVEEVKMKMANVKHKILVLSGKGGVGKSTFTAHLAHGLASDENTQVCSGRERDSGKEREREEREGVVSWILTNLKTSSLTNSKASSLAIIFQVAVLDVDICGPSIPKVMGLEGEQVHQSGSGWSLVVSQTKSTPAVDLIIKLLQ